MIDLNNIESYRENNRIEAKKALGGLPHSIWETYSAFANTLGGLILLGVEEYKDKSLHPVDLPDPEGMVREFMTLVSDPKKASVNILSPRDVMIEEVNGGRIIIVNVPRAARYDRPVYVDGDPKNTFRRNGEGDYRCSPEEFQAMERDAAVRTQDMRPVKETDLSVLSRDTLRDYRERICLARPEGGWDRPDDTGFLVKLGAAVCDEGDQPHPTAGGLLMFGRAEIIRGIYPDYLLEYREDRDGGEELLTSASGDWSGNILDFYFRVRAKLREDGRALRPEVPDALDEALTNCLINADYFGSGGIRILNTGSGISFENPGSFRIGLDRARRGGRSDPRNSVLQNLFHQIRIGEQTGSGIPHIFRVWREQGWAEPVISQTFRPDRIGLTLRFGPSEGPATGKKPAAVRAVKRRMIIEYLTDHASAKTAEIADFLAVSPSVTRSCLRELIAAGIVAPQGNGRNRVYKLKS